MKLKLSTIQYLKNGGFSMMETIIAIFILSLAGFGAFILIQQTLIGASANQMRLTAYYLGQEGFEIVRNIRDTNWLQRRAWTTNLNVGGGALEADYLSNSLVVSQNRHFRIDANGFYNYTGGAETRFRRQIFVTQEADGHLRVRVRVEWQERGQNHWIEVNNLLYNWYVI